MDEKNKNQEFIPEYFTWMTMEEQRKKTENLENITKKREKKNK